MPLLRYKKRSTPHALTGKTSQGYASLLAVAASGFALTTGTAQAEEPRLPTEPSVLRDTSIDILDVADAFDGADKFDFNLRLSFEHDSRSAPIRRETNIAQPGLTTGGYISSTMDVATYYESTQRLVPDFTLGLYHDLALSLRLPVILANTRRLEERGDSLSQPVTTAGLPGEQLFSPEFQAPTRSGIEYFAVGLDWGIMNQFRNPARPNWVVGVEGRFNVSEPLRACNDAPKAGQVKCAHDADINRNGEADDLGGRYSDLTGEPEGNFSGDRGPGVSRGTTGLEAHAYVSKRLRYIEPYTGVAALFEFQGKNTAYGPFNLEGTLVNHPPLRGTIVAGLAVIPWEQPEKYRRISLDFRVRGTYVSEGRDYSELFDALGSSDAPSLRNPNFTSYAANVPDSADSLDPEAPSVIDQSSNRVHFTGLTDVQQHGDYEARAQFTWQASRYVKFDVGGAWRVIQEHFITFDQACNPDVTRQVVRSGPCKVDDTTAAEAANGEVAWKAGGLPNPHHRKVINDPGQRFVVDTSHGLRAWVRASVLF